MRELRPVIVLTVMEHIDSKFLQDVLPVALIWASGSGRFDVLFNAT